MRVKRGSWKSERGSTLAGFTSAFGLPRSAFWLLLAACATVQDPPGGPPDLTPPLLVSIAPDSGTVLGELNEPAVIQFNEVINERPGVPLDQLIIVSPRGAPVGVAWKRDAIEVKPKGGWRPNVPYRLTLLPGVTDLRNNRLVGGRTVVFSTGGQIPDTRATGRVVDWEAGGALARALIELTRTSDSLVFWDLADSTGAFALSAVPRGQYVLSATSDRNNNRQRDYREAFDSVVVTLDSTLSVNLWTFVHDTVGPRIRTAQRSDSLTIRLEFTQPLAPGGPPVSAIRVRALPDSTPLTVTAVQTSAARDSARAAAQPADTTRPPAPSAPIGVIPRLPAGPPGARPATGAPADSTLIRLLATRPRLNAAWIVTLGEQVRAGGRYLINATVSNASGAVGESSSVLIVPAAPARRDSAQADSVPPSPSPLIRP